VAPHLHRIAYLTDHLSYPATRSGNDTRYHQHPQPVAGQRWSEGADP